MSLYRRLVPLPEDLPEERRAFLHRVELLVWAVVTIVQALVFGGHMLADALTRGHIVGIVWHVASALGTAAIGTIFILRYTFRRSAAEARQQLALRDHARLEGALLVTRTALHEVNNALAPVSGFAELLLLDPTIRADARLENYAHSIFGGAQEASLALARLQQLVRLEENGMLSAGPSTVLDLERSTAAVG
jgi:signal transduction histidine kinase